MDFSNVIKELRRKRKLTQGELAQMANISQTEVSLLENGNLIPKPKHIGEILKILNTTPFDESEWFKFLHSYVRYYLDELLSSLDVSVDYSETSTNEASIKVELIDDMIFEYSTKVGKTNDQSRVKLAVDLSMLELIVDGADETYDIVKNISSLSRAKREKINAIIKLLED